MAGSSLCRSTGCMKAAVTVEGDDVTQLLTTDREFFVYAQHAPPPATGED